MPDMEKVIKGLHEMSCRATWEDIDRIRNKFQPIINGAIGLLKEQDAVVRCKDCEDACICSDEWVICTHIDSNGNDKHPTDWFCADGRRRDE